METVNTLARLFTALNLIPAPIWTLGGVVIGAMGSYLTTSRLATQSWQRQRQEQFYKDQREALTQVEAIGERYGRAVAIVISFLQSGGEDDADYIIRALGEIKGGMAREKDSSLSLALVPREFLWDRAHLYSEAVSLLGAAQRISEGGAEDVDELVSRADATLIKINLWQRHVAQAILHTHGVDDLEGMSKRMKREELEMERYLEAISRSPAIKHPHEELPLPTQQSPAAQQSSAHDSWPPTE